MIEQICLIDKPANYKELLKSEYYIIYHPIINRIVEVKLNDLLSIEEKYVTIFYSGSEEEMDEMYTYISSMLITIRNSITQNIIIFSIEHLASFLKYNKGVFELSESLNWYVAEISTDITSPQKLLKGMISPALIMEKIYSKFTSESDSSYELKRERYVVLHNNFIDAFLKYLEDRHDIKLAPFLISTIVSTKYQSIKLGEPIPDKFNIEFCEKFFRIGNKNIRFI